MAYQKCGLDGTQRPVCSCCFANGRPLVGQPSHPTWLSPLPNSCVLLHMHYASLLHNLKLMHHLWIWSLFCIDFRDLCDLFGNEREKPVKLAYKLSQMALNPTSIQRTFGEMGDVHIPWKHLQGTRIVCRVCTGWSGVLERFWFTLG